VLAQQKAVAELQRAALAQVTMTRDDNVPIAITVVKVCLGTGKAMDLQVDAGGYRYSDGGAAETGGGDPPPNLVRRVQAYKALKPDAAFKASCDTARERYKRLATELSTLSAQAAVLAETPALSGDCPYLLRPDSSQ
jgi:hypothetical protein